MEESPSLQPFPKIELHEHLDGSLRPQTVVELARSEGVRLPTDDPDELAKLLSPGPSSLEVYLRAFAVTVSVLQSAAALRRAAFETVEDWARDGVVYGETRFAPEQHLGKGLSPEAVVEAVLKGLEDGSRAYPVETGLILCSMRHAPPTLATARLVEHYRDAGVVGFDLAGAEAPFRPALHRQAFEYCAEHLLAATCHAGEVTGPDYIREALVACRSLRIGHGTQLIQEWGSGRAVPGAGSLTRWMIDRRVPLELCLTSNVQTKAVTDLPGHPFDEFRRAGLAVTLNTDNRLVSATTLSRELELARRTWKLTEADLMAVQRAALEAAFCAPEVKNRIRAKHFQ
jgi:adenosine deaminase